MTRVRAFTLMELLVVMAIIAILAALFFSVMGHVKASARAITCRNNLRQWGIAVQLYTADHDDFLPPEGWANPPLVPTKSSHTNSWYVLLPQTIGLPSYYQMAWRSNSAASLGHSIWICPSNPRRSNGTELFHYCLNGLIDGAGKTDYPTRLVSIPCLSKAVYLFDSKNLPAVDTSVNKPGGFVHTNLHNHGAQFVFLDGHVAWFNTSKGVTNNSQLVWYPYAYQ